MINAISDKLKGNWNQIKGKLKQEYGELNDDDLAYAEGQEEELIGRIQEKTGKTKEEIQKFIDNL
ncbi:MAG: CsbD family protein [Cryomorphaceae bacterium]|nr:CsbD family protein [Flavobacteriales bacterium]